MSDGLSGPVGDTQPTGIEMIAAERQRQIEVEGFTPEHDAGHDAGYGTLGINAPLALAAACYAIPENLRGGAGWDLLWPWTDSDWKPSPTDRARELTKAGALIAAEIDRLQSLAAGP